METGMMVEKQELLFLLSCRGCRSCPSVFRPKEKERPERILEGMFQKGWITNTGDRFQVTRPLAEAVRQIAGAGTLLCLCHGNRERELLYLYPGKKLLAVQESFTRRNALRLLYMDREGLQLFLEEQGLLGPDPGWEPLPYVDGNVRILPEQVKRRSELAAYPWLLLLTEILDGKSGWRLGAIGIVRKGFQDEIVEEDTEGSQRAEAYTAERFMERLLKELEEYG